jgi:hypothetical protein
MGWTGLHIEKGETKNYLISNFTHETARVIGYARKLNTVYMAVENTKTKQVFGAVILLRYVRRDHYNLAYKDMDESMGPNEADCPENILNMLTEPAINDYAKKWRERCRQNLARKKNRPKIVAGTCFKTNHKIRFTNGSQEDEFKMLDPKRLIVEGLNTRSKFRFRRAMLIDVEIIKEKKTFSSKQMVVTAGVASKMKDEKFESFVKQSITRHFNADWGISQDKAMNDSALENGDDRIMSVYEEEGFPKIWIITEWDRSVTTVLFPSEY